jgi:hypothetical protein
LKLFFSFQFSDLVLQGGDSLGESLGFAIYGDLQVADSFGESGQFFSSLGRGSGGGVWHESTLTASSIIN